MDPITVLQSRIAQLEAKLGLAANAPIPQQQYQQVPTQHYQQVPAQQYQQVPAQQYQQEAPPQQYQQAVPAQHHQQGDSITANLLNTAQAMNNATAGMEKLPQAMNMANELNNYTDPNLVENMQQNAMHMQEVAAAEPAVRHHCHCMHRCKQSAPVMESEPILQVPQMQEAVDRTQASAAEVRLDAEAVAQGVQELAETCGQAAEQASEQLANVAQKVEAAEQKMFPKRRNGLD